MSKISFKELFNNIQKAIRKESYYEKPVDKDLVKKKLNIHQSKTAKGYKTMSYIGHESNSGHAVLKDGEGNYIRIDNGGKPTVYFKD